MWLLPNPTSATTLSICQQLPFLPTCPSTSKVQNRDITDQQGQCTSYIRMQVSVKSAFGMTTNAQNREAGKVMNRSAFSHRPMQAFSMQILTYSDRAHISQRSHLENEADRINQSK